MEKEFYKSLERDIEAWEKKHGKNIYSPKAMKELEAAKKRWAKS